MGNTGRELLRIEAKHKINRNKKTKGKAASIFKKKLCKAWKNLERKMQHFWHIIEWFLSWAKFFLWAHRGNPAVPFPEAEGGGDWHEPSWSKAAITHGFTSSAVTLTILTPAPSAHFVKENRFKFWKFLCRTSVQTELIVTVEFHISGTRSTRGNAHWPLAALKYSCNSSPSGTYMVCWANSLGLQFLSTDRNMSVKPHRVWKADW